MKHYYQFQDSSHAKNYLRSSKTSPYLAQITMHYLHIHP